LRKAARGELIIRRFPDGKSDSWDVTERATILLGAFALENAIKAFLVYENPSWISNGKLALPLRSHDLIVLRHKTMLIPYKSSYTSVLEFFGSGIESWARYPCSLTAQKTTDTPNLTDKMWQGYLTIMRAYGRRLEKLLEKGWNGPHGRSGAWDCATMEYLRQN
jgi:hypothetical protein